MTDTLYPKATREIAARRRELAPEAEAAFQAFSKAVFAEGALSAKTKQLIAVAVAHAVPLLHHRPHQGRQARRRDA
jgi:alkylhydroperoxidase/carboxymuconolactone decarboxylase family protein YurZ